MKKSSVLFFSIFLLGITFYGLSTNSYYVQILMNLSMLFIYIRIALVVALLIYVFVPSLRLHTTRTILSVGGILMLSLGVVSVGSPTLLGHTSTYILLGDSFTLIEAGILSIFLSVELSAERSRYIFRSLNYVRSLVVSRPRDIIYFPAKIIINTQK